TVVFNIAPSSSLTVSALQSTPGEVIKNGDGSVTLNAVKASRLSIDAGKVVIAANGTNTGLSVVNDLHINGTSTANACTGQLDVKDNDVVIHTTGALRAGTVDTITNQLKQGSNFAQGNAALFWTGNGIISSLGGKGTAATGLTAVGVAYNDKQ